MIITIYSDAGHGWAKVNIALLEKLGIADKVSFYSYMRDGKAYLEEDCDLGLLIEAMTNKGMDFRFDERHTDKTSRIRNYNRYVYKTLEG